MAPAPRRRVLRRVAVAAGLAAIACASPAGPRPGGPGDVAEREARAAWVGLPSTANGCPEQYDYFPAGGLASFYCHARSLLTLERLEQLAGMRATRPPPPGAPVALEPAFRHYDPRFVDWLRGALLPARRDPRFRERTQPVYDRYVAPLARQYLATRRLMLARRGWTDAEVRWVRAEVQGGTLPERYYQRRYATFDAPATVGGTTLALDRSAWDPSVGPTAVAFWIRRELDGSAAAFAAALEELVALYDAEWLRAGAGVVPAAPSAQPEAYRPSPGAAAPGGMTIARLWAERGALAGRKVRLVATVVSAPHAALGTSWFRVADGSGSRLERDDVLLVTSSAAPAPGAVVAVEGTVGVNRDFGAGTIYPLVLEDARVAPAPEASATPVADPLAADPEPDANPAGPGGRLCGTVVEHLRSPPYAYLRLSTRIGETWVALSDRGFARGERVCVVDLMPMTDFTSRALKRTFARISFAQEAPPR